MTGVNGPVYYAAGTSSGATDLYPSTILIVNVIGSTTTWTDTFGPGTVNVSSGTSIVINATGTNPTGIRKSFAVVAGQTYQLRWAVSGASCSAVLGNTSGGGQYKGLSSIDDPLAANSFVFTTTAPTLFVQFQRTTSGTCTITDLALEQLD